MRRCASVSTPVRGSNVTPAASRPIPSTSGARPDRHQHEVALRGFPFAEVNGQRGAGVLDLGALLSEDERRSHAGRTTCAARSWRPSPPAGSARSSISIIVTSVPKRSKIDANSQPMIPPPRTTRRFGTSVCARSPVESTQCGDSSPGDWWRDRARAESKTNGAKCRRRCQKKKKKKKNANELFLGLEM